MLPTKKRSLWPCHQPHPGHFLDFFVRTPLASHGATGQKELNINPPPVSMSFYSCVVTSTDQKAIFFIFFLFKPAKNAITYERRTENLNFWEIFFFLFSPPGCAIPSLIFHYQCVCSRVCIWCWLLCRRACESERAVWEEADVPMIALFLAPRWVCRQSEWLVCHRARVRARTCSVVNKISSSPNWLSAPL